MAIKEMCGTRSETLRNCFQQLLCPIDQTRCIASLEISGIDFDPMILIRLSRPCIDAIHRVNTNSWCPLGSKNI